jgi:hypothetical protein
MDNLFPDINRGAIKLEALFDGHDCAIYSGAISTGGGEENSLG